MDLVRGAPIHLLATAGLLALLVLAFLAFFLVPGVIHWFRLRRIETKVDKLEARTPPGEFRKLFASDKRLAHLWKQYQDSLHIQREERGGQMVAVAVRATLPADTFLNTQSMVDGRLRTEFFKHLPGIFTGIGIIGTFTGLISGLRQFQVSENAATVRASLEFLMHAVGEAFLISASAIAAAMLVTFIEKLLLASLYAQAEEIAHAIDARFDAGAGEDYLSRLVKASEDSATQSKTLKDALVSDLGQILRELSTAQIDAARDQQTRLAERFEADNRQQSEAIGAAIAGGIEKGLKGPLEQLAQTLKPDADTRDAQRDVERESAAETARQGARDMQAAMQSLQGLVRDMAEQLRGSRVDAGRQLEDGLGAIGRQLGDTMQALTDGLTSALGRNQAQALSAAAAREEAVLERTASTLNSASGDLSEAARKSAGQMEAVATQMAASVRALSQTTSSAIDRMNAGAESMNLATKGFAAAADRAGAAMGSASSVASALGDVSGALSSSAAALMEGLGDHREQREALGSMVAELRETVALARKEASLSADVLSRLEASTQRLNEAQRQTDQYLAGVSHVLGDAHQAFAVSVRKTLELANTEFHGKLSTAVGLLASTIAELESVLGNAVPSQPAAAPSSGTRSGGERPATRSAQS